jgi:hypothetical protein
LAFWGLTGSVGWVEFALKAAGGFAEECMAD